MTPRHFRSIVITFNCVNTVNLPMNALYFPILALLAGAAIATQASLNAHLGVVLKNSVLATVIAFTNSLIFTLIILFTTTKTPPSLQTAKQVPFYLWFSGGLLSTFGIATFYWLIPKMGIGPLMSFALTGQLLLAMLVGHFGWFHAPIVPISLPKIIGIIALVIGIVLINQR